MTDLVYLCDAMRHLICVPYTVPNLHRMASELGIARCWFHRGAHGKALHYDIPKRRIAEIQSKCVVVDPRTINAIMRGRPISCEFCSRTDFHIHCPECGDTSHVAAQCDMMG